jgi:hypothetical protein
VFRGEDDDEDDESCIETGSSSSATMPTQNSFADFVGSLQNLVDSVSPFPSLSLYPSSTPKKQKGKKEDDVNDSD